MGVHNERFCCVSHTITNVFNPHSKFPSPNPGSSAKYKVLYCFVLYLIIPSYINMYHTLQLGVYGPRLPTCHRHKRCTLPHFKFTSASDGLYQFLVLPRSFFQGTPVLCSAVLYRGMLRYTALYCTLLYCTVLRCTALNCTLPDRIALLPTIRFRVRVRARVSVRVRPHRSSLPPFKI